jgi:hypothetical protein
VKIQLDHWEAYLLTLGDRAISAVKAGVLEGALQCIPLLHGRTEQAIPASANGSVGAINTGAYRRRWMAAATAGGSVVYNDDPSAAIIERGRRAGGKMPPLRAIARWVQRRLQLSEQEAAKRAYPFARAIARRGLRARNVMGGALAEMGVMVRDRVRERLQEELRK